MQEVYIEPNPHRCNTGTSTVPYLWYIGKKCKEDRDWQDMIYWAGSLCPSERSHNSTTLLLGIALYFLLAASKFYDDNNIMFRKA